MEQIYKNKVELPASLTTLITEELIQGTESIYIIAAKYNVHASVVRGLGRKSLGLQIYTAREERGNELLRTKILSYLAQGHCSQDIARNLGISPKKLYKLVTIIFKVSWNRLLAMSQGQATTANIDTKAQSFNDEELSFIQVLDSEEEQEDHPKQEISSASKALSYKKPKEDFKSKPPRLATPKHRVQAYNNYHHNRHRKPIYSNQITLRYEGVELSFSCGSRRPESVVLELMHKVMEGNQ